MLTGDDDRPLEEIDDGDRQGRTEGDRSKSLEATRGKVGKVCSGYGSLSSSSCKSRRIL